MITIAIVGDYNAADQSHVATSDAVGHSSAVLDLAAEHHWVGTEELTQPKGLERLAEFSGFWIAPGSPYKSMLGALSAIRMAREQGIPLLGTCGGFQHIILEYAREVLGFAEAEHEETDPQALRRFISRLTCSLVGRTMSITLQSDSLVARTYGRTRIQEQYRCNYGVNPDYVDVLRSSALRIVGSDDEGVVRVVELAGHPFFVGTLFVPQFSSHASAPHPLVSGFIKACSDGCQQRRALGVTRVPGLRSSYEKVGGIVLFGRMLDKIRLQAASRLPPGYNLGTSDWSWFDARCTRFLGVDYPTLVERVLRGGTDEEILEWCFQRGRRPNAEEVEIWNDFLTKRGWRDSGSQSLADAKRERGFEHRDDIQTWFDFHRADE